MPISPPQMPAPGPTREQLEREKEQRDYRRARRKARERAGEIKELNITAMMDMMTIILVFLLKSYTTSSLDVNLSDALKIPQSTTIERPADVVKVTISLREVSVNDRFTVPIVNGAVPVKFKDGKADNFYVAPLYDVLKREVDRQRQIAQFNDAARKLSGRVNVIADKRIPYRTLIDVLYTAGRAELSEYQFMVLKSTD